MRYHAHFGELPLGAFEHCGDKKIKPQGGGGVPIVSDVVDVVSDVGGDILDFGGDVVKGVGDFGEALVKDPLGTVGNVVEGALDDPLKTAATAAAIYFGLPYLQQAMGAGALGASSAADAAFIAQDAASLASQGLSSAQIASTLEAAGVGAMAAADAAALASSGLGATQIASNLAQYGTTELFIPEALKQVPVVDMTREAVVTEGGNVVPATTLPSEMATIDADLAKAAAAVPQQSSTIQNAVRGVSLANSLLGQQAPQSYGGLYQGSQIAPRGMVDYSPTLSLLETRVRTPNIYSLLG
jgi:hypothetical protein